MPDPTPAEALKAEDIAARALFDFDVATERRIGRERNRKWETELPEYRDHMRAKASAMLAALPSPATDAGEVRTVPSDEWQGIESAPKDGTEIDLFGDVPWRDAAPKRVPDCAWKHLENGPDWHTRGDKGWEPLGAIGWTPTHWRPLPAPPAAAIRGLAR